MADYATVNPNFWTGETGREVRKAGPEAQLVSLYLLTNTHRNPLGLYYLPKFLISHETSLSEKGASKGLRGGILAGFCAYDGVSEVVWVIKMAFYQIATELKATDKRVKWVNDLYQGLPNNPFLYDFWQLYGDKFHIEKPRGSEGASKGLRSPIDANININNNININTEGRPTASRHRRCAFPDDFKLNEDLIAYAKGQGINGNVESVFAQFQDHHKAKGTLCLDWAAAWRTWVRNEIKFAKGRYHQQDIEAESAKARKLILGE